MKKFFLLFVLTILVTQFGFTQQSYTSGTEILKSVEHRSVNKDLSIYSNYPVRNVGPVAEGGRITDIAVNASNTKEFYVAFASGGVFKTVNNGITFDPVFDNQGALTIGDICLSPSDDQVLWVGTGENNSSSELCLLCHNK